MLFLLTSPTRTSTKRDILDEVQLLLYNSVNQRLDDEIPEKSKKIDSN